MPILHLELNRAGDVPEAPLFWVIRFGRGSKPAKEKKAETAPMEFWGQSRI